MSPKYERITNVQKLMLIRYLKKLSRENNARIWRYVAELLQRPRRNKVEVNISKINRYTKEGDLVVVPGKVLGAGILDHPVTVAALAYSESARKKILEAGGQILSIEELASQNPKGSNIKIII